MNRDFSFGAQNRIKTSFDFQAIYQSGHKFSTSCLSAFFLPSSKPSSRLGISIPKRTGNAVFRNRQKRIIREVFRHHFRTFACALDIVITLHRAPRHNRQGIAELKRIMLWLTDFRILEGR